MALTAEEQRELDELEYEELLAEEAQAIARAPMAAAPPQEPKSGVEAGLELAQSAGQLAGRVLDYPGGIARTAIATAVDPFLDEKTDLVNTQDWLDALAGKAPISSEYLERGGVGELGSVDVPVLGKVTGRGALGFVADVATDPFSLVSKVGKGVEKAGTAAYKSGFKKIDERLAETGTKSLSDVLLANGIYGTTKKMQPKIDALSKKLGVERDLLYAEAEKLGAKVDVEKAMKPALEQATYLKGVRGAEDLGESLTKNIRKLYEPVGEAKVTGSYTVPGQKIIGETTVINPQYGPHGEVLNADELIKTQGQVPIGSQDYNLVQDIDPRTLMVSGKRIPKGESAGVYKTEQFSPKEVKLPDITIPETTIDIVSDPKKKFNWLTMQDERVKLPSLSLSEASELKTRLRDTLPEAAFNNAFKLKGDAKKIAKTQAAGIRQEIITEANKVKPGLGDKIDKLNEDFGAILGSKKQVQQQVRKGNTVNAVTPVDVMLGGATAISTHNPYATISLLGLKKAADIAKTTGARTTVGMGLTRAGQAMQRAPKFGPEMLPQLGLTLPARAVYQSPWLRMKKENE
jgi:hypothetical protein